MHIESLFTPSADLSLAEQLLRGVYIRVVAHGASEQSSDIPFVISPFYQTGQSPLGRRNLQQPSLYNLPAEGLSKPFYWSIQVVSAFEGDPASDKDPQNETGANLGGTEIGGCHDGTGWIMCAGRCWTRVRRPGVGSTTIMSPIFAASPCPPRRFPVDRSALEGAEMFRLLALALLSLIQVPPPLGDADLRVTLSAVKSPILVGEFTKARAEWVARRQISVLFGAETFLVDAGNGWVEHAEASLPESTTLSLPTPMAEGDRRVTESVLGLMPREAPPDSVGLQRLNGSVGFLFHRPGTYRVKLRYEEVESNEVLIQVMAPTGADADLFTAVSASPGLLAPYGGADDELVAQGDALVGMYGGHVYLVPFIRQRCISQQQPTFDLRSSLNVSGSAFAADELLWRAEGGAKLFDEAWAHAAFTRVVQTYPGSAAAQEATERSKDFDSAPPTLAIAASPSGLWPPNGKLVPVHIVVTVSDNVDAAPTVRLTAITCDDGCNPATDVDGAAIGTDDRAFSLRARRTGGGSGRTYTITYTATDASQLQSVATATVLVPHDRRN